MQAIDFDFLIWLEQTLCVPTFYTELLDIGVERNVALAFAYSDAIRKRCSILGLYQSYGRVNGTDDSYSRGFMQFIDYRRSIYDSYHTKEEQAPLHTVQQAPFVMEDPMEDFPFTPEQQQTLIDTLAVPMRVTIGEGYGDSYYVEEARPVALVAMKWAQVNGAPAKPVEITPEHEAELKQAMAQCAVDQLGSGYVDSYYRNFAGPFIAIAKWWAQNLLSGKG